MGQGFFGPGFWNWCCVMVFGIMVSVGIQSVFYLKNILK
jgi:hypothetical protein